MLYFLSAGADQDGCLCNRLGKYYVMILTGFGR